MYRGMIHIRESDPPINVYLTPTVPITCPSSANNAFSLSTTYMSLDIVQSIGLDISDCSVTFTDPVASQTLQIAALDSSSTFSRVARIVFSPINSPGSPWHGYTPAHCPVCLCNKDCALLY